MNFHPKFPKSAKSFVETTKFLHKLFLLFLVSQFSFSSVFTCVFAIFQQIFFSLQLRSIICNCHTLFSHRAFQIQLFTSSPSTTCFLVQYFTIHFGMHIFKLYMKCLICSSGYYSLLNRRRNIKAH